MLQLWSLTISICTSRAKPMTMTQTTTWLTTYQEGCIHSCLITSPHDRASLASQNLFRDWLATLHHAHLAPPVPIGNRHDCLSNNRKCALGVVSMKLHPCPFHRKFPPKGGASSYGRGREVELN